MYGLANGSSRRPAAYYWDAYSNCQNYSTYNTIQNTFSRLHTNSSFAVSYEKWDQLTMWPLKMRCCRWSLKIHALASAWLHKNSASPTFEWVWRVINAEGLYPYKRTPVPELLLCDVEHHMFFCNWSIQTRIMRDVIYSNEVLFTKQGIYNHRNKHFWSNENPYVVALTEWSQERFLVHM